jgi:hypothetical protein
MTLNHIYIKKYFTILNICIMMGFNSQAQNTQVQIFETSASGNSLTAIKPLTANTNSIEINIHPQEKFQKLQALVVHSRNQQLI